MFFLDLAWDHLAPSPALLSQFEICRLGYSFFDNSRLGYQCYQCDVTIFHLSKYEPSPHLLSCAQSKILIIFDILSQSLCCRITLWWRGLWLKILIPSHKRPMSVIKATIKLIFDKTIGHFNSWKMRPERARRWELTDQHIHSLAILPCHHILWMRIFVSTNFSLLIFVWCWAPCVWSPGPHDQTWHQTPLSVNIASSADE